MEATGIDYRVLAVLFAGLLYTIVWIVNSFFPWREEVGLVMQSGGFLQLLMMLGGSFQSVMMLGGFL